MTSPAEPFTVPPPNRSAAESSVALPTWYAGLDTALAYDGRAPLDESHDRTGDRRTESAHTIRIGPLTIVRPAEGAETAVFGSGRSPSVAIFDGYLFDRRELAAELGLAADVRAVDLVAAAYGRWRARMFERLNGCYLAAVWDGPSRTFFLGHDVLSRHPAFYAIERGTFWFGSNVLALASSGHVPATPNRLSLALAALTHWPAAGQTFFERIRRVRAGHYLAVAEGPALTEHKCWDPLPDEGEPWLSDHDAIAQFEPALERAVARCMALAPEGIMLSGGVDSVTVAALAANHAAQHRTPTLVAVSGRSGLVVSSEERMQSSAAQALKMPHLVSTTREWTKGRDDVSLSLEMTEELPAPSRIYWVGTYMSFYRQTAAQRLHVLLTGSGGDNWLAVAESHAADLIRERRLGELYRFVRTASGTGGFSWPVAARRILWNGGLRPLVDTFATQLVPERKLAYHTRKWREHLPAWLCPDKTLRDELVVNLIGRRTPGLTREGRVPRNYYQHSLRSTNNPYLYYEFETAFHIELACGLRLLSPYHDRDLVRLSNRISPRALLHGGRYKGLLRPLVAKHLPGLGFERQRKDYPGESQTHAIAELRTSVERLWPLQRFDVLGQLGIVDPSTVADEIARTAGYGINELVRLFSLMSAERWLTVRALARFH